MQCNYTIPKCTLWLAFWSLDLVAIFGIMAFFMWGTRRLQLSHVAVAALASKSSDTNSLVCRVLGGDKNDACGCSGHTCVTRRVVFTQTCLCVHLRQRFCQMGCLLCLCKHVAQPVSGGVHGIWTCICVCVVTCLCSSDESSVSLTVLPVDFQVGTLRQRYDHVHKTLVARDQQSSLR